MNEPSLEEIYKNSTRIVTYEKDSSCPLQDSVPDTCLNLKISLILKFI